MIKRTFYFFLIVFSLLFNIQAGFSHDIEHFNHESHEHESHDEHESHEDSNECNECLLNYHLVKSPDFSNPFTFDFLNNTNLNSNYLVNNSIVYTFVAYRSRAP